MEKPLGRLREKKKREIPILHATLRGLLLSLLFLLTFLAVGATVALQSEDPTSLIPPISYAALLSSALFSGVCCARTRGKQGLLCGLLSGGLWLCLFALGFFLFSPEGESEPLSLLLLLPVLFLLSVFGGIIGGAKRVRGRGRVRR